MRPQPVERPRAELVGEMNGYVETDPTARYGRFDEMLGKGAMKTVYRAFDELNGIEVAWNQAKICNVMHSPEALERMYSEVQLLSSLNHDSIIKFHASWIDAENRTFNFITEMFTSGTLREYRQRYSRVDVKAVKRWARQILQGLVYLHGHDPPVIHRDLKCDNIFVNGHLGQVKIGDLGLAAMLRGTQCAHSVIGTPEFMAPEVYEEEYTELVDMYSFGMCVLEMITSEYPYSECSNSAQIYKKVTSGKLPDAYHRLKDPQAKRFIGRCLERASERASATELLLDPFLALEDHRTSLSRFKNPANVFNNVIIASGAPNPMQVADDDPEPDTDPVPQAANMTISGKINPEDDTIFLKVQIADQEGKMNNIYFPFDTVEDTPLDVANEMVKELDIRDREPSEIAEMIAHEITSLVPGWKEHSEECHQVYNYVDDKEDRSNHPFYYLSSPTSSQGSVVFGVSSSQGYNLPQKELAGDASFLGDDDDDDISSVHPINYSAMNYALGCDQELCASFYQGDQNGLNSARFCIGEGFGGFGSGGGEKSAAGEAHCRRRNRRLLRNQSMMDLRSQLLHRALVEELNKRTFKTICAVENRGCQVPCSSSSSARCNYHRHRKQSQGPIHRLFANLTVVIDAEASISSNARTLSPFCWRGKRNRSVAAAMPEAQRSRSLRFRAPPPTPIATGKGQRSAAVDDRLLTEYLEGSLRVPDLSLPDLYFPVQSPLKAPEEVDLPSLLAGDDSAVRRVLSAASEVGAVRVTGVDAALIQGAKAAIEAGGAVFALPEQEKSRVTWFGRRDGVCDEFYWHQSPNPETEQLLQQILPDSYRTLRIKMENIAVRMETVAGCIAKILFKDVTSQTTSRRFGNVQPILCLRKYESPHRNDTRDLTDANSLLSYALCLHISAHDENFCIRRPEGSAIFKMSACDILVTIGKPFQDWCNGEFKAALGEMIFPPTDDPTHSFSLEYMCYPQLLSPEPDYGAKPVSLMDQILVVIVLAILYKLWLCIFS